MSNPPESPMPRQGEPWAAPSGGDAMPRLELRVHGVRGSTPDELLGAAGVERAAGDRLAGFWRSRSAPSAPDREAYVWGNLTTGRPSQALWLLLLPFALLNVAGWMIPPARTEGGGGLGPARVAVARFLVRLLALLVTLQFVLWVGVVTMDMGAYQCGGNAACRDAHAWLRWLGSASLAERPLRRLALGSLGPMALIAFLAYLGRRTTLRYEAYDDPPLRAADVAAPARTEGDGDDDRPLWRRAFWRNTRFVRLLGSLHVAAALTTVAMLLGGARVALGGDPSAGGRPPSAAWPTEAAFWSAAPPLLVAASLWLLVLAIAAASSVAWSWRLGGRADAAVRGVAIGSSAGLWIAALSDAWRVPTAPDPTYGWPPVLASIAQAPYGLMGLQVLVVLAIGFAVHARMTSAIAVAAFVMGFALLLWFPEAIGTILAIAVLATAAAAALAVAARGAPGAARKPARLGTPVALANLGVVVANVTLGSATILAAGWLGTAEGYHGPDTVGKAADAVLYGSSTAWLTLGFVAMVATVGIAAAIVGAATWLLEARPAIRRVAGQYDRDAAAARARDPLRVRAVAEPAARRRWTARPIRWWWFARLLDDADLGAWLLAALGASFPAAAWVFLRYAQGIPWHVGLWAPLPALDGAARACFAPGGREVCLPPFLTPTAATLAALLPVAGMALLIRNATRDASLRRTVGILWDIGTFWPRRFHPLAPPCYAERAVPELADRLVDAAAAEPRRVLVVGHSQGSVLAATAVALLAGEAGLDAPRAEDRAAVDAPDAADPGPPARDALSRLSLLTVGSPLGRYYARYFPAFCGPALFGLVERALSSGAAPRWRNAHRATDYIGGPVTRPLVAAPPDAFDPPGPDDPDGPYAARRVDPAVPVEVQLRDPYRRWHRRDEAEPEPQSHGGYFDDDVEVDALRRELP